MKILCFCVYLMISSGLLFGAAHRNEESRKRELEQVQYWEERLAEARHMNGKEKLYHLSLGLRNMGRRAQAEGRSGEVVAVFNKIKAEMLRVEGHAQYFADEIEAARAKSTEYELINGVRNDYVWRMFDFGSLCYLNSPEFVSVCGKYLYDTRQDRKEPIHGDGLGDTRPSLAVMASMMLLYSGIRDYPVKSEMEHRKVYPMKETEYLMAPIEKSRIWWEEVKSGKRALSFIGEDVEYRFKPDGSWEKFPYAGPPDPPKVKVESKVPPASGISKPAPVMEDWKKHWPWLAGAAALLAAVIVWFRRSAKAA